MQTITIIELADHFEFLTLFAISSRHYMISYLT